MAGEVEVSREIKERSLQWLGDVGRRNENYIGKRLSRMRVDGKRTNSRPKKGWKECIAKRIE